jgi:hypothetical protein
LGAEVIGADDPSFVVLVPTKGRPQNAARLISAWLETQAKAQLMFLGDEDDEKLPDYEVIMRQVEGDHLVQMIAGPPKRIGPWLNEVAPAIVEMSPAESVVGFMGDDHVPRTRWWDRQIFNSLTLRPGIVYGNDLFQGPNLPTAVFMTGRIIGELGYMVPPGLQHMYLDNAWKEWGERSGSLTYLADVVIEHMHPHAGKAEGDETYGQVWPYMTEDMPVWEDYAATVLDMDVARIRTALEAAWS